MANGSILFDAGPSGRALAFGQPRALIIAQTPDEVTGAFAEIEKARAAGHWIAGYASYELGYVLEPKLEPLMPLHRDTPLLCFGVFDGPDDEALLQMEHQGGQDLNGAALTPPKPVWSQERYDASFAQLKEYISAGDIYQANLTFPMKTNWSGTPVGLYHALQAVQPVQYGALIDLGVGPVILSRSPELFYRTDKGGRIETRPMKGTMPRGKTRAEDDAAATFLQNDPKNRAENLMIVDLLRNDLSRVSEIGSVKVPELFAIERFETVLQMTSTVQAQLRQGVTLSDVFRGIFPCGSITGAPKIRAMEIIRELEPDPRGVYCGTAGWAAPDGSSRFNVAIRTISLFEDSQAVLNVGGGVVHDSTSGSEYEEALWKARYTNLPQQT
jgi:para-aminobenzoate synthetase component 1